MGILDQIEAIKSHTNIYEKNAGTAGTRRAKSTLKVRKHEENCGSVSKKNSGTSPPPGPEPVGSRGKPDAADVPFMTAAGILKKYHVNYQYIVDREEAKKVAEEFMVVKTRIGIDIETAKHMEYLNHDRAGLDPSLSNVRLVQLYAGKKTVYVIDVRSCGIEVLTPLLEKKNFVAHNAVFEMKHFLHAGIDVLNFECTMLMGNAISGTLLKLSFLVEKCLGIKMSKEEQVSNWNLEVLTENQISYAAADAVLVFELYCFLRELVWEHYRDKIYLLMRDAQKAVAYLVLNGISFDTMAHEKLIADWTAKADAAHTEVKNLMCETINLNSSAQLSDWLKANLDKDSLSRLPKTKTGQIKTSMDALSAISDNSLIKPLAEYKKYKKLISTFGKSYSKFINPVTGRMHGGFRLAGTRTGRFSCDKPNVQNPPRENGFRELFKASSGNVIIVADYSQMQLRIAAHLSGDREMLRAYDEGIDLHRMTAAAISGIHIDEVTKDQRQMAKAANFGLIFGQGVSSFRKRTQVDYGISMTAREAQLIRNAFFETYLGLKQWQKTTGRVAKQDNQVETVGGRVREFSREKNGYKYTEALNTPVQGAEAEIILVVLSLLEERLHVLDAKLINIVHDEFVFEVAEADKDQAVAKIEEAMIDGMLKIFPDASTIDLVDIHVGTSWADAKG